MQRRLARSADVSAHVASQQRKRLASRWRPCEVCGTRARGVG
ncbi:hypothetical protein [Paraburkholderia acidiphila]|nr:hypothetical protein [Paraburkholderia acidiphila]